MIITKNIFPVLEKLLPAQATIIEAGAFDGKDTKKLSALFPDAKIHAFEPVPEIFEELTQQTKSYTNIYRHQIALSNKIGNATFYIAENPKKPGKICQAGTIMIPKDRLQRSAIIYPKTITVPTTTLDQWAIENNIKKADFIWLDLQGHELAVLMAGLQMIKTANLIFLEVNFIEAYHGQPTPQEINHWLACQGFKPVARDFADENQWFFGTILHQRADNSD
jgi:2-O-methyltransferase